MRVIWYTAMSIDGRIATPDNDLEFLETIDSAEAAAEFPEFLRTIDAIVIGATTMRWLLDNGHGWPHGDLPTWLVSHDPQLLARIGPTELPIHQHAGDLAPMFTQVEESGAQRVWLCGGGDIAGQALAAGHVDEVLVTIAPTVLGAGPSLFDVPGLSANRFTLAECRPYGEGSGAARLAWHRCA